MALNCDVPLPILLRCMNTSKDFICDAEDRKKSLQIFGRLNTELSFFSPLKCTIVVVVERDKLILALQSQHFVEVEVEPTYYDVRMWFASSSVLVAEYDRVQQSLKDGDLGATLAILVGHSLPSLWQEKQIDVAGTAALAGVLWKLWLAKESVAAPNRAREDSAEDLSQGWVMVHSVSPKLQERVRMFQQQIDETRKECCSKEDTSSTWLDDLIKSLYDAAESFQTGADATLECAAVAPPE
eukprot:GEMP01036390.1.p1 GENE.GEMP01036390.1~~GEMP01036390.1.p1  ORF type:complete len:241 (+),score=70.89 GEMP01036390.1:109-831(+)